MQKRVRTALNALLFLGLAGWPLAWLLATHYIVRLGSAPIQWRNLEQIRAGMSRQEVEALLGGPPAYHSKRQRVFGGLVAIYPRYDQEDGILRWASEIHDLRVFMDHKGRIVDKGYSERGDD